MTKLTRPMAQRLAEFIHMARDEWNTPGILAALEQASNTSDALAIARALVNIADDQTVKTPGMLTRPGGHWRTPAGELPPRRGEHNIPCPDHPGEHDMPCPNPCTLTAEQVAELAAEAKAALAAAPPYIPPATKRTQALEEK